MFYVVVRKILFQFNISEFSSCLVIVFYGYMHCWSVGAPAGDGLIYSLRIMEHHYIIIIFYLNPIALHFLTLSPTVLSAPPPRQTPAPVFISPYNSLLCLLL